MFCQNCGNRIPDDVKYCPNCGSPVTNNVNVVNKNINEKNTSLKTSCLIAYGMYIVITLTHISAVFSFLSNFGGADSFQTNFPFLGFFLMPIFYIIGLISTIVAKVSYPKNKHTTILLIISIILGIILVVEVIGFISMVQTCINSIQECNM